MEKLDGVFPALVTPMNAQGRFDAKAMERLVEYLLGQGVAGFYVGGSTGESYLLGAGERKEVLETVMQAVAGRAKVIANIGVFSTQDGIELARHADSLGVTAISSVPPFYFSFTRAEYAAYYRDILDAVSVPLMLYNVPAMSGVQFSVADFGRLLANERIIGIKYTSYDLFSMQRLLSAHPDKSIVIGHDEIFLSALAMGAQALIGSTVNLMAGRYVAIQQAFRQGQLAEAQALQDRANQVIALLLQAGIFKGVKAALAMMGLPCGDCRKPFQPLALEETELVRQAVALLQ